jgi:hypothetical protein
MKFFISNLVVIGAVFGTVLLVQGSKPVSAAEDEQAAVQAEHALNAALAKADKAAAGQLLDAQFEWTDAQGKTRNKAETVENLAALASDTSGETEIQTHNFGQVERFVGRRQYTRIVHLWVQRPGGWRAFSFMDTPIPAAGYKNKPAPPDGKDCINPCKMLPYKPANAAQRNAMNAWLATKMTEWHALPDEWPKYVSEAMVVISPTMWYDKAGRHALLVEQQKAYGMGSGSPAVESMQMYDFGNTVILRALHAPGPSGKRARALRMFVEENGVWKIALSDQTNIQ